MRAEILFLETPLDPPGGGQFSLLGLLRGLKACGRYSGVMLPKESSFSRRLEKEGFRCYYAGIAALPFRMLAVRPRLVHCNAAVGCYAFAGALTARLMGVPFVWHVRVIESGGWREALIALLSTRIVAVSRAVAAKFRGSCGKVAVISNPVDLAAFSPGGKKAADIPVPAGAVVVGVFGRLERWKGHGLLLEALASAGREGGGRAPKPFLLAAGDGPQRAHLEAQAARLGVKAFFAGFRTDIPDLMRLCSVVVAPSAEPEPFGRTVIEAMACGRPVVATDAGGHREIITNGKDGLLVAASPAGLAGAVFPLLEPGGPAVALGAAARATAEARYGTAHVAAEVEKLYAGLGAGPAPVLTVAIDCREFSSGTLTGIGRLLQSLIPACARLRPDWKFVLLGPEADRLPFKLPANAAVSGFSAGPVLEQAALPAVLRRHGADVFLSPYYKTALFSAVPSAVMLHDLTYLVHPAYAAAAPLYRFLTRLYAARAAAVLTLSRHSARDIERLLGISPGKISMVGAGVDRRCFRRVTVSVEFRARYGLAGDYLLYVGNDNPHKNVDGLLAAYAGLPAELRKRHPLVLCGPTDRAAGAAEGGYTALGRIPDADLPELYSGARLLVFPSFYEGFGMPPLEAMACGCPVASSGASCMPEILGDACLYFNPSDRDEMRDRIADGLTDGPLREELVRRGLQRAERYAPAGAAAAAVAALENIAGLKGGSS